MKVKAAPGIQVPMENKPHEYITDAEAIEVPDSTYYLRIMADGDLIDASANAKTNAKKGGE
ncbi:DUF2635 domain-containing protein [Craterilacuibacter sinensis]|uniref:DUF2635 domain-containing protein n=1 Tax=Craterilacuibacter sinensis TaxID=2686017 RepID=A0A845BKH5_9NEIS|nr:DUF2635 domain-containing protein [Craterilacuibacter sinensis]MXR36709.1 DUF2635 domain-containing protein [Craterilacuibacter sinensis]